ncbi:ferric iron uptake transcriptional regulator [Luminiphilus syltensis]|uniref:ferric iron uptake transcriptional regulator n=1 Tax=Luminiphilus syltensis TaxID=1341119 RepID=UPI0002F20995|nr:ferric iron uptake transcriptional regulator [Luminiphilus syltensis]
MPNENADLRKVGLKVTLPRLKIMQILDSASAASEHLSAEDVYQRLRDAGEDVGLATVYRVLTQFESAGLVTRHNFETGHSVFEMASDDHHDHMVDVDSNEVIEFFNEDIERLQHTIAEEQGFEIIDHSLVLYVRKKGSSG